MTTSREQSWAITHAATRARVALYGDARLLAMIEADYAALVAWGQRHPITNAPPRKWRKARTEG